MERVLFGAEAAGAICRSQRRLCPVSPPGGSSSVPIAHSAPLSLLCPEIKATVLLRAKAGTAARLSRDNFSVVFFKKRGY